MPRPAAALGVESRLMRPLTGTFAPGCGGRAEGRAAVL